jgi:putative tryptophan/tyrosine transport system substrate-binding protein
MEVAVLDVFRFICGVIILFVCLLSPAEAQQVVKNHTIGHLLVGTPTPQWARLWDELKRLNYIEGQNLIVERRYVETPRHLETAAADLVNRNVEIIVTGGTPAALAAKQATITIPIVFSLGANLEKRGANPVDRGLVASYERPGGNITGFVEAVVPHKKLEILKEAIPNIVRVACPCRAKVETGTAAAAQRLGLELQDLDSLQLPNIDMQRPEHFAQFVEHAKSVGTDGILMPNLPGYGRFLPLVGKLTVEHRIPAIGFGRAFVEAGGLLSLGPKEGEGQVAVASIVDRILRGAKPADIPVVHQRDLSIAVNLNTATSMGLMLPPALLDRANEVIR